MHEQKLKTKFMCALRHIQISNAFKHNKQHLRPIANNKHTPKQCTNCTCQKAHTHIEHNPPQQCAPDARKQYDQCQDLLNPVAMKMLRPLPNMTCASATQIASKHLQPTGMLLTRMTWQNLAFPNTTCTNNTFLTASGDYRQHLRVHLRPTLCKHLSSNDLQ